MTKRKQHWETVYETKGDQEVSWYQEIPVTSLNLIDSLNLKKDDAIIDVGGGNSNLVVELSKKGFKNLSVLDISAKSLERTKLKLKQTAENVNWIVSDILEFQPSYKFSLWHDRATFHFLTEKEDIEKYIKLVEKAIKTDGFLIIATFSNTGPLKCSGLEITQYSEETLLGLFHDKFELINAFDDVHKTPFKTEQNFIYTVFKRK